MRDLYIVLSCEGLTVNPQCRQTNNWQVLNLYCVASTADEAKRLTKVERLQTYNEHWSLKHMHAIRIH